MYPAVVSPEWLAEHAGAPDVRVFDVTFFEAEPVPRAQHLFAREHIAGSTQLLLRGRDFSGNFFGKLPKPGTFALLATAQGFSRGVHAVLYDRDGRSAARCWLLFQHFGFVKLSLLLGGLAAYARKGLPMVHKRVEKLRPAPSSAFAAAVRPGLIISVEEFDRVYAAGF